MQAQDAAIQLQQNGEHRSSFTARHLSRMNGFKSQESTLRVPERISERSLQDIVDHRLRNGPGQRRVELEKSGKPSLFHRIWR